MTISATTQGIKPGVCTSTNRPSAPFDGQVIYMTDVDQTAVWDGTQWTVLAPIAGGRNMIINGGFDVWQRGTSFTANNVYTADRWWFVTDGVGTATVTQQAISSQGLGFTNCLRAERSAGTNRWVVGTNLETVALNKLKGKTVTLSFYARKGSALTSNLSVAFETKNAEARFGGAVDTVTVTVSNASMNTSTFTRFTGTLNVPAGTSAVGFALEFSATQAGAANAFFEITGVQVEAGAIATPFEFEDAQITLAKCQRYFEKTYNIGTNPATATQIGMVGNDITASANHSNYIIARFPYKVTKRAAPTVTTYDASGNAGKAMAFNVGAAGTDNFTVTADFVGEHSFRAYLLGISSAGFTIHYTASAEL